MVEELERHPGLARLRVAILGALVCLGAGHASSISADDSSPTGFFEGEVHYRIELESRHPRLSIESLKAMYGESRTMIFNEGSYRLLYDGGETQSEWFLTEKSRDYALMVGEDFLREADSAETLPIPEEVIELPEKREILGLVAHSLLIRFKDGSQTTFWYSPRYRVDPDWFTQHRVAGFHLYYPRARSIILEYDRETPILRRRYIATSIVRRPVDPEELRLPDLPRRPFDFQPPEE